MILNRTKHSKSLSINLETSHELIERAVLKLFDKEGRLGDNYSDDAIIDCMSYLLDIYLAHMPLLGQVAEIKRNLLNLELKE